MPDNKSRQPSENGNCGETQTGEAAPDMAKKRRRDPAQMRAFGERLRLACDGRGVQHTELGEQVGARPNTVWRWMDGQSMPGGDRQQAIADYLSVPLRWLLRGGPNPPGLDLQGSSKKAADPVLTRDEQRDLIDSLAPSPHARACWSTYMMGIGADQLIRKGIVLGFIEVAELELRNGEPMEVAAKRAGEWALNAAMEAYRQEVGKPRRGRSLASDNEK